MKSKVTYHIYSTILNVLLESITLEYTLINTSSKDQVKQQVNRINRLLSAGHRFRGDVCVF